MTRDGSCGSHVGVGLRVPMGVRDGTNAASAVLCARRPSHSRNARSTCPSPTACGRKRRSGHNELANGVRSRVRSDIIPRTPRTLLPRRLDGTRASTSFISNPPLSALNSSCLAGRDRHTSYYFIFRFPCCPAIIILPRNPSHANANDYAPRLQMQSPHAMNAALTICSTCVQHVSFVLLSTRL